MSIKFQQAKFAASYQQIDQVPKSKAPEISFVGRSNVGKSSLMNKIFNRRKLVKTSSKPGCTQAVNFFEVPGVDFVDLPGYGFARVSKSEKARWSGLIEGYFEQPRRHALCVQLVDIRHDALKLDIQMTEYLLAHEIPFIIVFTKADKLKKGQVARHVSKLCKDFAFAGDVTVLTCSSETGQGVADLRAIIEDAVAQANS